jgi:hypothetical protein
MRPAEIDACDRLAQKRRRVDDGPSSTWPCPPTAEIDEAIEDESLIVVEGVDLSQCCFGMVSQCSIPHVD